MSSKSKFLVLNPSPADLDKVLQKANLQNQKNGPFEAVFLLGDVIPEGHQFPTTQLDQPTYFTGGQKGISAELDSLVTNGSKFVDLAPNLTFVSSLASVLKLKSGLTVMFVSGESEKTENQEEVNRIIKENSLTIDILLTYNWPQKLADQEQLTLVGNKFLDEIVQATKPRYHFCVGHDYGKFYENKPFKWDSDVITRFISLGQEGSGEKWFYAFNLSTSSTELQTIPVHENPFTKVAEPVSVSVPKRTLEESSSDQVVKKPRVVSPESCFFCLSNPKVETHMIVSIGSHAYLTVAKGPLTRSNQNLSFSGHAIIIPIEHIPTLRSQTGNIVDSPIYKEIQKYQTTLVKAFAAQKESLRLVFFEVCRGSNVHQNTQVIAIPEHLSSKLASDIQDKAQLNNEKFQRNHKLDFQTFTNENDPKLLAILNDSDYVVFTLFESATAKTIYISELSDATKPVDFQFPRRVLAHTLNLPKRVYWEKCQQPKLKESADCEAFKKFYRDFDFTIE